MLSPLEESKDEGFLREQQYSNEKETQHSQSFELGQAGSPNCLVTGRVFALILPFILLIGALFFLIGILYFLPSHAEQQKAKAAREAKRRANNRRIAE